MKPSRRSYTFIRFDKWFLILPRLMAGFFTSADRALLTCNTVCRLIQSLRATKIVFRKSLQKCFTDEQGLLTRVHPALRNFFLHSVWRFYQPARSFLAFWLWDHSKNTLFDVNHIKKVIECLRLLPAGASTVVGLLNFVWELVVKAKSRQLCIICCGVRGGAEAFGPLSLCSSWSPTAVDYLNWTLNIFTLRQAIVDRHIIQSPEWPLLLSACSLTSFCNILPERDLSLRYWSNTFWRCSVCTVLKQYFFLDQRFFLRTRLPLLNTQLGSCRLEPGATVQKRESIWAVQIISLMDFYKLTYDRKWYHCQPPKIWLF